MRTVLGTVWVCTDCLLADAYGDCDPDRAADLPAPLSMIGDGHSLTSGMMDSDHGDWCTPADREEQCNCGMQEFSTSRCDGCGDSLHGTRHAMTLWLERHVVTECRYGPDGLIRKARCTCGAESLPIADGVTVEQIAAGHAIDGELLPSPDWGQAD